MKLVIDASVALKWFLRELQHEPHLDRAEAVAATLDRADTQLLAPVHWTAEVIGKAKELGAIQRLGDFSA